MINIRAKDRPKWYNYQWRLSNLFMWIARKIYPANPEVKALYVQMIHDRLIYGGSVVRVDHKEYFMTEKGVELIDHNKQ